MCKNAAAETFSSFNCNDYKQMKNTYLLRKYVNKGVLIAKKSDHQYNMIGYGYFIVRNL